jgi:hypothetical protein
LTELVDGEVVAQAPESADPAPLALPEVVAQEVAAQEVAAQEVLSPVTSRASPDEMIQAEPAQADTWSEQLHVRMGKLTDDIHTLNARLDRLDERSKTKV